MAASKELTFCLRQITQDSDRDTDEQAFVFDLFLPEVKYDEGLVRKNRSYSRALYERLSVEDTKFRHRRSQHNYSTSDATPYKCKAAWLYQFS